MKDIKSIRGFNIAGEGGEAVRLASRLMLHREEAREEVIHEGRNRITRLDTPSGPVAVKYFSRSLKNRLIYAIFSSKAERSFLHALELKRRGISTPRPLAYAERRGPLHTLDDSLYICEYEEATDLRDYLEAAPDAWRNFARFTALLHSKGIVHRDLNNTNVRVRTGADGTPLFSLIDLNRIKFKAEGEEVTGREAYANLVRFSYLTPGFHEFAREYTRLRGLPESVYHEIIRIKEAHERRTSRKKARKKAPAKAGK